ncbi:hypothetical protein EsDP_00004797 [Epichloe bromicola]|uniref:SIS domain-containing protein n=1 Tax=Epichloe bromicola TaxID=79588 RepID=A0ABQ0CSS7_9HYPO
MSRNGQAERHPVQTSAVIVLGARQGPALPPPSPPTPCVSPSDSALVQEPTGCFSLEQPPFKQGDTDSSRVAPPPPPPQSPCHQESAATESRLRQGMHVLNTEATALADLSKLYETDSVAREGFNQAVRTIARRGQSNGKLVIIGVGKSGHIGKKLVATMQSLGIAAVCLHPTEALHGDLGIIDPHDTLMFITYSGKTQELMLLLPHLDEALPTIVLTSHIRRDTCEMIKRRPNAILLPAPIPESEATSFGVAAPTSSTTVALALGDALAITAAKEMHHNIAATFAKNHPGGAIGAAATTTSPQTLKNICVLLDDIPHLRGLGLTWTSQGIELLRAGVGSVSGWVRTQDGKVASPSQIRQIPTAQLHQPLAQLPRVFASSCDMLAMSSDTPIRQAGDVVRSAWQNSLGDTLPCSADVIGVTEGGEIIGVLEARRLFELHGSSRDEA